MKIFAITATFIMIFSCIALSLSVDADAARLGGGRSFGSRPSMNTPAQRPTVNQQQHNRTQQAGQPAAPGRFGGMGGILGGLLAGTLLGSLLSGSGFSGGGFLDIILLGILAFIAYKLYMKFRQSKTPAPASAGVSPDYSPYQRNVYENQHNSQSFLGGQFSANANTSNNNINIPPDFNVDEFLQGAKMTFVRLQKSWDARDLQDISQFVTDSTLRFLKERLAEDPNPGTTEIIQLKAEFLGIENDGSDQRAQVFFDALMRENGNSQAPEKVNEIWHFVRNGVAGSWKLDGIQQVQ